MSKKVNYNSKIAHALLSLIKQDKDLWIKGPNENAFNSNLYRRIKLNPYYKLDMEYDDYSINDTAGFLASPELRKYILEKTEKTGKYNPQPDIISHYENAKNLKNENNLDWIRKRENIIAVVECKFNGDRERIWRDFLKLSAYKLMYAQIEYLCLVIYPKKKQKNPSYKSIGKKQKVWNKKSLNRALDLLEDNEGVVLHVNPYPETLDRLFSDGSWDVKKYSSENKTYVKFANEIYEIKFNNYNQLEVKISKQKEIPINEYRNSTAIFKNDRNTSILEKLANDDQIKILLHLFGMPRERKFSEIKYLRSGFRIQDDTKIEDTNNFEPYLYWRNTIVLLYENNCYKMLLQNSKDFEFKNLELTTSNYSDSPRSIWKAYKLKKDPGNMEIFKSTLMSNLTEIKRSVLKTTKNILKSKNLTWDENCKEDAIKTYKSMQEHLS